MIDGNAAATALDDAASVTRTVHPNELPQRLQVPVTGAILKKAAKEDQVVSVTIDERLPDRRAYYRSRPTHLRLQWRVGDLRALTWQGTPYDAVPDPSTADGDIGQCPEAHGALIGPLQDPAGRQLAVTIGSVIKPQSGAAPDSPASA